MTNEHKKADRLKRWPRLLFRGVLSDIEGRAPFYLSDFKDAWDYRVIPATVYMYFTKYVVRVQVVSTRSY
jgi:hypothetical protein